MLRHVVRDTDLTGAEQQGLLQRAAHMKAHPELYARALTGKSLGMIFQKSSTRTRVSFEAGMHQLGGHAIFLSDRDVQLGRGETVADTARVLSRYVDILMIRTFNHHDVQQLAQNSQVPVINGLDDLVHPCQALADLLTLQEHCGSLPGRQLVYVGDGNNMAHSLMLAGALAGLHVRVITPPAYAPHAAIVAEAQKLAQRGSGGGATIEVSHVLNDVAGADAVYTDVWASMGQEAESDRRHCDFSGFQVNAAVMARAGADAIFLHCLPAHRGEEVAAEVIDGPRARVYNQAENRLHVQKALMVFLLDHGSELLPKT